MSTDRIEAGSLSNLDPALAKMAALSKLAAGGAAGAASGTQESDFQSLLQNAIRAVNEAQNTAQVKAQSFSTGQSDMSLEEVMVSLQNASVAFQGMIAVRNRLVEAYRDVINLQV